MGKKLGDPDDPLLISVRSGAKFSMPGMMETVLNIGLNDRSVEGIARQSGSERFAWDSYRRLLQMFGKTVLDIDGKLFDEALEKVKSERGTTADLDLTADDFKDLIGRYKLIIREQTGADFPQDPREQLNKAIHAVFDSWNTERAVLYRRQERIPADLGTAVNVMAMVFGNVGMYSGTGVAFTRDPGSGDTGEYGDYLQNAQGEDVVAGIRNTLPLHDLERLDKASYDELTSIMGRLEQHYRDLCDIEFTIERGKLWMLQTRVGKRTAGAAFRIATQLVDEGLIDMDEALQRVNGAQLMMLMFPQFDASATDTTLIGRGMNASPGAAVGKAVFDSHRAVDEAAKGEKVILVRKETNPDDLNGMIAAQGILTSRGGKTSHAAVVARGMGKTCVSGADELDVDVTAGQFTAPGGVIVREGDVISIDGTSGAVFLGEVPVVPSPVVQYFEGTIDPETSDDPLVKSVHRLMLHADEARRLGVEANADTPEDAARARRFGAGGIGLCRTEHMFLGDRRKLVERLILADTEEEKDSALQALLPMQRQDFIEILEAMDGLPVTIRLLDPPLHEFLPSMESLSVERAVAQATGKPPASGREQRGTGEALRGGRAAARAEPHAGNAGGAPRPGGGGAVRAAGAGDLRSRDRPEEGRRRPAAADHDSAHRRRAGVGVHPGRGHAGARAGAVREQRRARGDPDRHDDRAAAGGADRRRDRPGRRLLLVRDQRPDADHLGLLPRRRRGGVLHPLSGAGHLRRVAVRDPRPRRGRCAGADGHRSRPRRQPGAGRRGLR